MGMTLASIADCVGKFCSCHWKAGQSEEKDLGVMMIRPLYMADCEPSYKFHGYGAQLTSDRDLSTR